MLYSHLLQVVVSSVETALVTALVSFLVIQGLKELLALFNVDLTGNAAAITAVVVMVAIAFVNGLLVQIPAPLVPFAEEVQKLIDLLLVAIFGPMGIFRVYKSFKRTPTPFK